jgi:hypothetical protein
MMTMTPLNATVVERLAAVPVMYWLLWLGSVVLCVALVIVLRTQWGQSRPLQKCAVLSLLVHALLACLAMTIRVVVGDGGGANGAPIRVRLVDDSEAGATLARVSGDAVADLDDDPTWFDPPEPETKSTADANLITDDEVAVQPPPLLASPPTDTNSWQDVAQADIADALDPMDPGLVEVDDAEAFTEEKASATPITSDTTALAEMADDAQATESIPVATSIPATTLSESSRPPASQQASTPTHNIATNEQSITAPGPSASEDSPSASRATAPYALRAAPGRLGLVELQGGSAQTEAAVAAALAWLARAQSDDGRWEANRFGAGQEHHVLGQDRAGAGRNADTGISALALLAFLGAGHTHHFAHGESGRGGQGDYQKTVRNGLEFLMASQGVDGNLCGQATFYAQMYCHSMATFALAEAQVMTGDVRLKPAVDKAIGFSVRAQNPATGGWRYRPTYDTGDTSQLGWQMMALASGQRAGVEIPAHTWTRIGRFLKSVRRGSHGGLAAYRPDGPASTSMTAEAMYCWLLLHDMVGVASDEEAAYEATNQMLGSLPGVDRVNLYYWYYATLALHKRQHTGPHAAAAWRRWNEALIAALIESQVDAGENAGSWDANTVWGGYGGRVYTTAMAAMCLEVYYRYTPADTQHPIATKPDVEPGFR